MKMTRMEWAYLKKIALDHPYFDTHKLPLTEAEAKAIVKANNTMTGEAFVDSVYERLGMVRPKKERKPFAWLHSIGDLFAVPPIRRLAIAVLAVILLAVFFAATPTGRAVAESVCQYVIQLLDKHAAIIPASENEEIRIVDPISEDYALIHKTEIMTGEKHNSTIAQFSVDTGKRPLLLPLSIIDISYETDMGILLTVTYQTDNNAIVTTIQEWDNDETIITVAKGQYLTTTDYPNIKYAIDANDNSLSIIDQLEDSVIIVFSDGTVSLNAMIEMLSEQ